MGRKNKIFGVRLGSIEFESDGKWIGGLMGSEETGGVMDSWMDGWIAGLSKLQQWPLRMAIF
jgi:hypothetical protein